MKHHSLVYQQYQISYFSAGEGEPLLLLHGWPVNHLLWQAQIEKLSASYRVIAIDWLGFGASDHPTDHQYTFTAKKEILNQLIHEVVGINQLVSIIAHDVGGPPAILWASENTDRVKQLLLLNTVLYPFSTPLDRLSHFSFSVPLLNQFLVSSFGLHVLMRYIMTKSGNAQLSDRIREILQAGRHISTKVRLKTILEPLHKGKKKELVDLAQKLSELQCEKHLIIAKGDPLCYAHMKKITEQYSEIPAHYIQNCGHFIPIDQPEALNEVLLQILKTSKKEQS
ncbi:MAG: alpha/beta hydrolase [Saprospiraceae bacterium]|nr:alpha/beta hydrolase [Saprospiraceae bacterium]